MATRLLIAMFLGLACGAGAGARADEPVLPARLGTAIVEARPVFEAAGRAARAGERGWRLPRLNQHEIKKVRPVGAAIASHLYARGAAPAEPDPLMHRPAAQAERAVGLRWTPEIAGGGFGFASEIVQPGGMAPEPDLRLNWTWRRERAGQADTPLGLAWGAGASGGWSATSEKYSQGVDAHLGAVRRLGGMGGLTLSTRVTPRLSFVHGPATDTLNASLTPSLRASKAFKAPAFLPLSGTVSAHATYGVPLTDPAAEPAFTGAFRLNLTPDW